MIKVRGRHLSHLNFAKEILFISESVNELRQLIKEASKESLKDFISKKTKDFPQQSNLNRENTNIGCSNRGKSLNVYIL